MPSKTARHGIAEASPQSRWACTAAHGFGMLTIRSVGWSVGYWLRCREQRAVDAIPAISSAAFAGQRFGFGRGDSGCFGFGEQLADPVQLRVVGSHRGSPFMG